MTAAAPGATDPEATETRCPTKPSEWFSAYCGPTDVAAWRDGALRLYNGGIIPLHDQLATVASTSVFNASPASALAIDYRQRFDALPKKGSLWSPAANHRVVQDYSALVGSGLAAVKTIETLIMGLGATPVPQTALDINAGPPKAAYTKYVPHAVAGFAAISLLTLVGTAVRR